MLVFMFVVALLGSDGLELSPEESIRASASLTDLHERLRRLSRQKYPPASEMPAIIDLIRQSDSEASRLLALRALTAFQTRARQHVPTVVEMTDQKHPAVIRCAAIESLFRCGMESGELRKVLNAAVADKTDASIRWTGIELLSEVGARDAAAEKAYLTGLHDENADVCKASLDAVVRCGIVSDQVMQQIRALVNDVRERQTRNGEVLTCVDAIECIEAIGARDHETVAVLTAGLERSDLRVQIACAMALYRMSPKLGAESLDNVCRTVIKSGTVEEQDYLVDRAIDASPQWEQRIEVLCRLSLSEHDWVRRGVELHFQRDGADTRRFIQSMSKICESTESSESVKARAKEVLKRLRTE